MIHLEIPKEQKEKLTPYSGQVHRAYEELLANKKYGFLDVMREGFPWSKLADFKSCLNESQQVGIIGIGGSSQGQKSFLKYVSPDCLGREFVFFDRIDESYINGQMQKIESYSDTTWYIISKSGKSTETLFILNTLLEKTEGRLLANKKRVFALTEAKGSVVKNWADQEGVQILDYPQGIEGRFSLFSFMGLYPMASHLKGVEKGDNPFASAAEWIKQNQNLVLELSQFYLQSFQDKKWISMFWLYSERLKEFGFWLEQLWAESLGKFSDEAHRVSTPFCCYGTNDQHSLLQQMEEGYPDKSHVFLQIKKPNLDSRYQKNWISEEASYLNEYDLDHVMKLYCQSTYESLQGQPRALMTLRDSSEEVAFALHLLMALVVGTVGRAMGIEIYGQPGVEKSKKLFRELL